MSTININATKIDLELMLEEIKYGKVQLPDFQREWRWTDSQIKSLLASVSIGIPIGAVLTLEGDEQLAPRPFAGITEPVSPATAKTLILDGQQRLTTLFQACYSEQPVTTKSGKHVTERNYYFDMNSCLNVDLDREECVRSETLYGNSTDPEVQYEHDLFPTSQMFDYIHWRDAYLNHHQHDTSKMGLADRFYERVVHNFVKYSIPIIRMEGSDLETVCIAFEKNNVSNTRLNAFEIITAKMKRENLDLKADWEKQKGAMSGYPILNRVDQTNYLKAITLLSTNSRPGRVSARRKDLLALNRKYYEEYNTAATKGFQSAAGQLKEFGITAERDLVNVPHVIVMAAVYAHCAGDPDTNTIRARTIFKRWYWTTLLNESYGTRVTDEKIAHDFTELIKRLTDTAIPELLAFSDNPFNSQRLFSNRQNSLTIAVQSMLAKEKRTQDWMTGRPMDINGSNNSEMHHIFPKKWCSDNGVDKGKMESVANMTLIDGQTNKIIGSKSPSVYLKQLQERAGNISDKVMDQILESHLIPADALRKNDFETFHKIRAKNLKEMIEGIIGKDRVTQGFPNENNAP